MANVNKSASQALHLDYSLIGVNARAAVEKGLAEADWYQCPVPRETMRALLTRRDWPGIWNTVLWFSLIFAAAYATVRLWRSWWALLPYLIYAALYASTSDSRWHESGHGTAFRTDALNILLYEIASFMVMRESTVWRWSHTRHHSDTIIVGRDPEIAVPRPPDLRTLIMSLFALGVYPNYFRHIILHAFGRMTEEEKTFIPEMEFPRIFLRARICCAIYALAVVLAVSIHSILPLFFIGLPNLFGTWLLVTYGLTQHAGLAENVLDHRLNCRTIYMNPIHRFLYWNMNYHVEHHMYPLVPFHALPRLHEAVKDDCPTPYPSLFAAWREIVPTVLRQVKDPAYHVKRVLPEPRVRSQEVIVAAEAETDNEGWVSVCPAARLPKADVLRFDYGKRTFALVRNAAGALFATDGMCTHGNVHLSDGLVKGGIIECPKHNGRYNLADGSPARAPICRGLATYPIVENGGILRLNVAHPGGAGARHQTSASFRVISNQNVATFIKELVLEPLEPSNPIDALPGDYMQLCIPAYENVRYADFDIPEPFASVWRNQHIFNLEAENKVGERFNNYSLANNPDRENLLRFNVRIATPPPGQACAPGIGSSYIFGLKPGQLVSGIGPFGDFHIRPTQKEMIYIGGGAGMAPLRAHLSHLLEVEGTSRRISFWYGARSRQEIFYDEYFHDLERTYPNFKFHLALSSPLPGDDWHGLVGFVHEVLLQEYLLTHPNVHAAEYYLCGPPMMIRACQRLFLELGVATHQVSYDEF
jgi:Na+-transporting NADH:ubiquinone oxidoreductase subunit F